MVSCNKLRQAVFVFSFIFPSNYLNFPAFESRSNGCGPSSLCRPTFWAGHACHASHSFALFPKSRLRDHNARISPLDQPCHTMGHKDVRAAMQYQHPELELVRAALNQGRETNLEMTA